MLRVWADGKPSGILDRNGLGSTFAYSSARMPEQAISLTMPVRTASWNSPGILLPIFEMNMPEGSLKARLMRDFAKAAGSFDDMDLLSVVGRQQIGRLRYSGVDASLEDEVPFQSVDEILSARRDSGLYEYLLNTYSKYSGISGVQPKVLLRGQSDDEPLIGEKGPPPDGNNYSRTFKSFKGATHIVKFGNPEFPELVGNEYFCLEVARVAGLPVPEFKISENGQALVLKRFDLTDSGSYRGFEDFCVLNSLGTAKKYEGSYESRLFKRIDDFAGSDLAGSASMRRQAFILMALNCAIRNGDAHLKNFGMLYDNVLGRVELAPVFDIVTTTAYNSNDGLALMLNGSTRWPEAKKLIQFGQIRAGLSKNEIVVIFETIANAISEVSVSLRSWFADRNPEIGKKMLNAWSVGVGQSLGLAKPSD